MKVYFHFLHHIMVPVSCLKSYDCPRVKHWHLSDKTVIVTPISLLDCSPGGQFWKCFQREKTYNYYHFFY